MTPSFEDAECDLLRKEKQLFKDTDKEVNKEKVKVKSFV